MAETAVAITAGSGTNIATFTDASSNRRQVVILGDTSTATAPVDASKGLAVDLTASGALPAGTNAIGTVTSLPTPTTSGGCSTSHTVSAASTNAANVKASAGQVYGVDVFNVAAYPIYVKFHNTAGTPTAGAGVVRTIGVQGGVRGRAEFPVGLAFATGIGLSITKGLADADTTAVAAADCVVDIDYK
jgi:hypothetical protein